MIRRTSRRPPACIHRAVLAPNVWNNGERVILHPESVMDTSMLAGHIAGWATAQRLNVEWVRPAHHGQGFIGAYPAELRPTRGKGAGKDRFRHMRSAWDVAGAALLKVLAESTSYRDQIVTARRRRRFGPDWRGTSQAVRRTVTMLMRSDRVGVPVDVGEGGECFEVNSTRAG